mgnify:CR=1 FL=1
MSAVGDIVTDRYGRSWRVVERAPAAVAVGVHRATGDKKGPTLPALIDPAYMAVRVEPVDHDGQPGFA